MTTLKAILIDDESASLRSLKYEIEKYCPKVEVIEAFQDPVKAIEFLQENEINLIFLDIEMPGMNGFEFLESFQSVRFDVIFVTAYDKFAIRAFEFNAVDYLLKPILKSKLIQSVEKVSQKNKHEFNSNNLKALVSNINNQGDNGNSLLNSIAIPTSEGFEFIQIKEIIYLHAESNYTWIYLTEDKKYLVSKTLKEVARIIGNGPFFRTHKSYLVNLDHVQRYVRGRGGYLILKDGSNIPVSRKQRIELLNILKT